MDNIFESMAQAGGMKIVSAPNEGGKTNEEVKVEETAEVKTDHVESPENTPKTDPFNYELFGKTFGGEWDENRIKETLDKSSKYESVLKEKEDYAKRVQELESIEKVDPLQFFSSEESFIREQWLLKNKDIDKNVLNVVSNLSPTKVEKLSDFDAVKTKLLIDNPDIEGGDKGAVDLLCERFGVTEEELADYDSLDPLVKNKIKIESKSAKKELKSMFEGIELPKKVDIAETRQSIKTSWEAPLKELVKGIDKLQVAEGYDFIVTDEMKNGLFEEQISNISNHLVKLDEESAKFVAGEMRKELLVRNMDKIIQSVKKDMEEAIRAEIRAEVHNSKPLNNETRATATAKTFQDFLETL